MAMNPIPAGLWTAAAGALALAAAYDPSGVTCQGRNLEIRLVPIE